MKSRIAAYCRLPTAYFSAYCRLPTACCLLLTGCTRYTGSPDAARSKANAGAPAASVSGGPPSKMLEYQVGDRLPEMRGAAWLNGPPPTAAELEGQVVVIDIWNDLCGFCREVTPDLKRLREKYQDRGVVFIGYTSRGQADAEAFVRIGNIPWPNAYGVGSLAEAAPVLYVLGSDGRIAWSDGSTRFKHQIASLGADLEAAIEQALDSRQ